MLRLVCLAAALFAVAAQAAEPAPWKIDPAASRLEFVAKQAGAEFRGAFTRFDADVRFDPAALAESRAVVRVPTASVATFDDDRDGILRGQGWFECDAFPEARFEAASFVAAGKGFRASGTLTLRNVTVPVVFEFELTADGLRGHADLDRIALGLGLGDWANEEWIGHAVRVEATVVRAH